MGKYHGEKSFVTLEQQVCLVCGTPFDTGSLLMDTSMRERFERNTITGWGMCPEHQKLYDDGFLALVEATSPKHTGDMLKQEDAIRTGVICHLRRTVADEVLNVKLPANIPMIFVEPGVVEKLQSMTESDEEDTPKES